jgi:hypothetical protein
MNDSMRGDDSEPLELSLGPQGPDPQQCRGQQYNNYDGWNAKDDCYDEGQKVADQVAAGDLKYRQGGIQRPLPNLQCRDSDIVKASANSLQVLSCIDRSVYAAIICILVPVELRHRNVKISYMFDNPLNARLNFPRPVSAYSVNGNRTYWDDHLRPQIVSVVPDDQSWAGDHDIGRDCLRV